MAVVLGLDTGGTYTDAVLLDRTSRQLLAKAKALTRRQDLARGLGQAMGQILDRHDREKQPVEMVCLSTTLATNAVVEGAGERAGLVLIGFDEGVLSRAGLDRIIQPHSVLFLAGGHRTDGRQQAALDEAGLDIWLEKKGQEFSAFAIASHFATRNPAHEQRAADLVRAKTGKPVTSSHELADALGGPRRALTALLNARLIGLLDRLIEATLTEMKARQLSCPLMVVKGDGSLLGADFARARPVETILSGPAASLAGAALLAGEKTALIADIGGTTTDIALLLDGSPQLSGDGARVGGWQTMVTAARIRTSGLGGDSEVSLQAAGRQTHLQLGPRRALPLSLLASQQPEIKKQLTEQLAQPIARAQDGRFLLSLMPAGPPGWLTRSETALAHQIIEAGLAPLAEIAATQVALGATDRLIARGLVQLASFTPTDAAHITGSFTDFDVEAARLGGQLMARRKDALGEPFATAETELAEKVLAALADQSAQRLLEAALAEQGSGEASLTGNPLIAASLSSQNTAPARQLGWIKAGLSVPLIALGASAATHYPAVADRLGAELSVPEDAGVAGAVGAAAGSVRQQVMILTSQPEDGVFRVHLPTGPQDFRDLKKALQQAEASAGDLAGQRARAAGAKTFAVTCQAHIEEVNLPGGKSLFIEARTIATAQEG